MLVKKTSFLIFIFSTFFVNTNFVIKPLKQVLQEHPEITYQKVLDPYKVQAFPFFNEAYETTFIFDECYILNIAQGKVQGMFGNILLGDDVIYEMLWAKHTELVSEFIQVPEDKIIKIDGKVLVLSQISANSYCHFLQEVLGRLALVEMQGLEYDYIYLPIYGKSMQAMLDLWGIDSDKIISPSNNNFCIQADNIILPSFVFYTDQGFKNAGLRTHPITSTYIKNKLLQAALKKGIDTSKFSKRVFVSRKDAPYRNFSNEDDVFALFEAKGFVRYELSKLSLTEQILLMNNAEIVVGEHGAGLTNFLFCRSGTLAIELFQKLIDNGNWWVANIANLNYKAVNCLDQDISWAADWAKVSAWYSQIGYIKIPVLLDPIKKAIEELNL